MADPLRSRRFFLAGITVGVIAMSATGIAALVLVKTPSEVAAQSAAPPPTVLTAVARWQVLTQTIVTPGIVTAARTISVTASAPFSVITATKMPFKVGDMARPGSVIAEIDGRPIILLQGRLPAYRNLDEGDSGPDVTQLQQAVERLGYADFDAAGQFGPSTALALLLLYRHLGYAAPLVRPTKKEQIPDTFLPMNEVAFVPTKSALVASVSAQTGSVLTSGQTILQLATGNPYVRAELTAYQAGLVRHGLAVMITSTIPHVARHGKLARVGPLPSVVGQSGTGITQYPIVVATTRRPLPLSLIRTPVSLTIPVPVTGGPVLSVPVSAIFADRRHGSQYVTKVAASGRHVRVPVFTGPTGDGRVAVQSVKPGALRPGDRVLIGTGS